MAHSLYTKGEFKIQNSPGTMNKLEGRFAFINQLDKYNNNINKASKSIYRKMNGREKEYQKFLFYKYFFNNNKPVIVTEGKTDIVYLKSALKNLHTDYPNLIKKTNDGKFEFKISFLRKTKRINYFFGISQDGADAMKNLYNFFSPVIGEKMFFPDYLSYFNQIGYSLSKNPVILVFDNEIQNNKKPLYNFAKHIKLVDSQKQILCKELSIKLLANGNLFLVTNQLIGEKHECEIEDLFSPETLAHQIHGKTFSPKDKFDISKHYGKEIFSQYISDNYEAIDFREFTGILNNISKIIEL